MERSWPDRSRPPTPAWHYTRRHFLERAGLLAGGALGTTVLGSIPTAAASPALSVERQEIHAALVETLGSLPGIPVDGSRAAATTRDLSRVYRDGDETQRATIDVFLGAVEKGGRPGSFARLSNEGRLKELAGRLRGGEARFPVEQALAMSAGPASGNVLGLDHGTTLATLVCTEAAHD